ncbi:MAG: head decoration protein [Acidocella sp.]|nr:head decoration protein [Acidocella sp.]
MPSPVIFEQFYDGAFMISEANGDLSKDTGYMDNSTGSDVLFEGGLVIVQATAGVVTSTAGTNTGTGTVGSLSVLNPSELGAYKLTATSATVFNVTAPSGDVIGNATVGVAFAGPQVGFTITAGGTAFVAGDSFTLNVTEQTGAWQSWTGGTITTPIGILYNRVWVEAGNFRKIAVVRRNAEVNQSELQWDPAVSGSGSFATLQATAIAALATSGIIAR